MLLTTPVPVTGTQFTFVVNRLPFILADGYTGKLSNAGSSVSRNMISAPTHQLRCHRYFADVRRLRADLIGPRQDTCRRSFNLVRGVAGPRILCSTTLRLAILELLMYRSYAYEL